MLKVIHRPLWEELNGPVLPDDAQDCHASGQTCPRGFG